MTAVDWSLFASTFALIFVAELPDKTAFATVLLAVSHRPLAVFIGACGAFAVQSIVAVAFGTMFSYLPERPVHIASGVLFLLFAVLMWRRKQDEDDSGGRDQAGSKGFWASTGAAFVVIFVAEWGDLTQLATATLVAKYKEPFTILISATLALWVVTGVGVVVGSRLKHLIQPELLQRVAAVAMAGVGIYLLVRA